MPPKIGNELLQLFQTNNEKIQETKQNYNQKITTRLFFVLVLFKHRTLNRYVTWDWAMLQTEKNRIRSIANYNNKKTTRQKQEGIAQLLFCTTVFPHACMTHYYHYNKKILIRPKLKNRFYRTILHYCSYLSSFLFLPSWTTKVNRRKQWTCKYHSYIIFYTRVSLTKCNQSTCL